MAAIIPEGELMWGMQLPIQSQSTIYAQPWESSAGPPELARVAIAAEAAGAFYVAVCDHIAIPKPLDETMGAVWYDTIATLGWLAAQTTRTHLLSHVAVLPYRHPLVTAKAWTTLDTLSAGRAILGVGAGHGARGFELLDRDFATRGRALDDAIDDVRRAFTDDSIRDAIVAPRPHRSGGPPIWVGGSSPAAMRRAARAGDGWLPQGPPKVGMRAAVELIRAERGDRGPIDLGGFAAPVRLDDSTSLDGIADGMRKARALGLSHLQIRFLSDSCENLVEQIEQFGSELWPLVLS